MSHETLLECVHMTGMQEVFSNEHMLCLE